MADKAAFTHRFVLINEGTALCGVTLHAGVVRAHKREAAAFDMLLHAGAAAFNRFAFVRIVTIRTTHFAFQNRMVMGQFELRAQGGVALETGVGRFAGIDDRTGTAAGGDVFTAGPMAAFAAYIFCVVAFRHQARVRRSPEITNDIAVTGVASFRADELGTGNIWWRDDGAGRFKRGAGKKNYGQRSCSPDRPPQFLALTVPSSDWPQKSHSRRVLPKSAKQYNAFFRNKFPRLYD